MFAFISKDWCRLQTCQDVGVLKITVLGCSGSYAQPGGACTGYLVQSRSCNVYYDCGPGTLANLQKHIGLEELDAVVLSHAHGDHWLELPVLKNALRWYFDARRIPVFANQDTFETASRLMGEGAHEVFDWKLVSHNSSVEIHDQLWFFEQTEHYVPTLAAVISIGSEILVAAGDAAASDGASAVDAAAAKPISVAFSSDTGPNFSFAEARRHGYEVEAAFVESTFCVRELDNSQLHLSSSEAASLAKTLGAKRCVLVHLAPGEAAEAHLAQASQVFDGPVQVAEIGEVFSVG